MQHLDTQLANSVWVISNTADTVCVCLSQRRKLLFTTDLLRLSVFMFVSVRYLYLSISISIYIYTVHNKTTDKGNLEKT